MNIRGRPAGQMTHRRQQVLERYVDATQAGERISMARIARECGIYDYRKVRRTLQDLKRMGVMA